MKEALPDTPRNSTLFLSQLVQEAPSAVKRSLVLFSGQLGHMSLTQLNVVGVLMMDRMGPLPRKVRHQEQSVQSVTNSVLKLFVFRKGSVSTLVRQHPQSHGHSTSDGCVGRPQWPCQGIGGIQDGQCANTSGCAGGSAQDGYGEVSERLSSVGLCAAFWQDLSDLIDGRIVLVLPRQGLASEALWEIYKMTITTMLMMMMMVVGKRIIDRSIETGLVVELEWMKAELTRE